MASSLFKSTREIQQAQEVWKKIDSLCDELEISDLKAAQLMNLSLRQFRYRRKKSKSPSVVSLSLLLNYANMTFDLFRMK